MNLGLMKRRANVGGKQLDIPYVSDGLVFWLDGINRGTNESDKWVDLIGGIEFTSNDGSDLQLNDNSFYFNGSKFMSSNTVPTFPDSTHAIEVCIKSEARTWYGLIMFGKTNNVSCWQQVETRFHCAYGSSKAGIAYTNTITRDSQFPVSVNCFNGRFVVNKRIVVSTGTASRAGVKKSNIGALTDNGEYKYKGYIYSIRVYNRQLTDSEIFHNQEADNVRFNLGITFPTD